MKFAFSEVGNLHSFHPTRSGYRFVCNSCCAKVSLKLMVLDSKETIVTVCPDHPSIMIQDAKVVGTAA